MLQISLSCIDMDVKHVVAVLNSYLKEVEFVSAVG